MDMLVIILIALGIFALALLVSKAYTLFGVWKKASDHGLSTNFKETLALAKFYELGDPFLEACKKFKALDSSISIDEVVGHHMADGDTLALLDKYSMIKNHGFDMSFKSAILYDLSGKDLNDIIQKQQEAYDFEINEKTTNGLHYVYSVQFRISADSIGWVSPNLEEYKWQITQKINRVIENNIDLDTEILPSFILEDHLNAKFWKELCHGLVMHQDLKIIQ